MLSKKKHIEATEPTALRVPRLERGGEVLAESGEVEVAWPKVVMEVPRWLETYHSPVDVEFG